MKKRITFGAVAASLTTALLLVPGVTWAGLVEVNTCGQEFHGRGHLSGDLDCTGFSGDAVVITRNGRLELGGFTLTGGQGNGILCERSCKIVGPGSIVGSSLMGVRAERTAKVEDVTVTGSGSTGIKGFRRVKATGSSAIGNGSCGISGDCVRMTNSTSADNGYRGVCAGRLSMRESTVTGNGVGGTYSPYRQRIVDSTVIGNGIAESCDPSFPCPWWESSFVDVRSCVKPRLRNTACGTSGGCESTAPPWGVCSPD